MGDDAVLAQLGKNAVDTGVDNKVVADDEIVARLAHHAIALVMGNVEVLHRDTITGIQYRVVAQSLSLQYRVLALLDHPGEGDIVLVDVHGFLVGAGHHLDDRAGAGSRHGVLYGLTVLDDDQFAAGRRHQAANHRPRRCRRGYLLRARRGERGLGLAVHLDYGCRFLARLTEVIASGQQDDRAYYNCHLIHGSVLHLGERRPPGLRHCEPAACPRATRPVRGV